MSGNKTLSLRCVLAAGLLTLRNFGRRIITALPLPHRVMELYGKFEDGVFGAVQAPQGKRLGALGGGGGARITAKGGAGQGEGQGQSSEHGVLHRVGCGFAMQLGRRRQT